MSVETLIENINLLPPAAKQEVFDFVNFLVKKYTEDSPESLIEYELTDSGKAFIDERIRLMQTDTESLSDWKEIKKKLSAKYGW